MNTQETAASFMLNMRDVQREQGLELRGRRPMLTKSTRLMMQSAITRWAPSEAALATDITIRETLLQAFQRMCRKQQTAIPDALWPEIMERLMIELCVNQRALGGEADKLAAFTAYQGAAGPELKKEFAEFRETPGVFRYIAAHNPGDAPKAMRRLQQTIRDLAADEKFAEFRETPRIFLRIAVGNPGDAPKAMRRLQQTIRDLAADEEFAEFRETPGIFLRIAVHNPGDAPKAMRRLQQTIRDLAADEKFAEFRETPGIFLQIAVGNPGDAPKAMRRLQQTIRDLAADEEFAEFRETPGIFLRIAVGNPDHPRDALRKMMTPASSQVHLHNHDVAKAFPPNLAAGAVKG